jgi:preprotein translocase subunit SecF
MSKIKARFEELYDKYYKLLLVLTILLFIFSLGYLAYFYSQHGDFIHKDISLTGGTEITIFSESPVNINDLNNFLSKKLDNFAVREVSDFTNGKQKAVIIEIPIESGNSTQVKLYLEDFLKYKLTDQNSSIESTGSSLSQSFYTQLQIALVIAFILMTIVVFIIFRTPVPSTAVVLSAFGDIIMTLAMIDFLGIKVSSAGITALLMLIGYSVDTDILLTTRLLKSQKSHNEQILSAFKTGITMTLTAIAAVTVALFITQSFSEVLKQIFTFLLIGLAFDIFNTWVTNVLILKWYVERKDKRSQNA